MESNNYILEAASLINKYNFVVVDEITGTYKLSCGYLTARFQLSPIYNMFKITISSSEDKSFCIEWLDLYALHILRHMTGVFDNLPSFTEGKMLDNFVDRSNGTIHIKDL